MKKKSLHVFVLFLTFIFLINTAEAKRFGGGRSFGKSWSGKSWSGSSYRSSTPNYGTSINQSKRAFSSHKKGFVKRALVGLVAGGLIASFLSGSGFHGLQGIDFIALAAIAFSLFALYQHRKRVTTNQVISKYAKSTATNVNLRHNLGATHNSQAEVPDWFNASLFIQGAKNHFLTLQKAWDLNDLNLMRTYCTDELFHLISSERNKLTTTQITKVLSLQSKLLDLIPEGDKVVAVIQFNAAISSNGNQEEYITEIWSVEHNRHTPKGDWMVSSIEQK
jgi:predicted lipid-binding transport protein (Tim44 family)